MKTQSAMSELTGRGDDPVHCQCDSPGNNLAPTFVSSFCMTPTTDLTKHLFLFIFMQDSGSGLPQMRSHEND
jgi:hypothetical protein